MGLFNRRWTQSAEDLIPRRLAVKAGSALVTSDTALRNSAVWACTRLRADLESTMPIDCYRHLPAERVDVEVTKPTVLVTPASHGDGQPMDMPEWMYSTRMDLDRLGNAIGIITAFDGQGLPAQVEPVPASDTTVRVRKGRIEKYLIAGEKYEPRLIWHERQYTLPGLHVGLSPLAYAAWSVGAYLSAQQFALDWFGNGSIPSARLKNTAKTIDPKQADAVKDRYRASVANGDLFVHGSDWDYEIIQSKASESAFLDTMKYGVGDVCRFLGVPGDMIDAESSSGSVTYANVTQRNLQLLIMNLGPAIQRRERALSRWLPRPRFVKFNTDAILRMDPETRQKVLGLQIDKRILAPSEARALNNLPPFTDEQYAEFDRLFPTRATQAPAPAGGGPS